MNCCYFSEGDGKPLINPFVNKVPIYRQLKGFTWFRTSSVPLPIKGVVFRTHLLLQA
jgi:hypothetical protein